MDDPLQNLVGEMVVLDTAGPIVYIGRLLEVGETTFLLEEADMHDCRDGHLSKEAYLAETREAGVTVNRREVRVMRSVVISVSKLDDVTME